VYVNVYGSYKLSKTVQFFGPPVVVATGRAMMKLCWTTLVVCWLAALIGVQTEMFTAVTEMKRMFNAEHDVARLLKSYVKKQHSRLASLSRYVTSL